MLVLTTYDADEWVFDAVRGASGYLLKDASRAGHPAARRMFKPRRSPQKAKVYGSTGDTSQPKHLGPGIIEVLTQLRSGTFSDILFQ